MVNALNPKHPERLQSHRNYTRHGKPIRPFTPEEDGWLLHFRREGLSIRQVAFQLYVLGYHQRSASSVRSRLIRLAEYEMALEDRGGEDNWKG